MATAPVEQLGKHNRRPRPQKQLLSFETNEGAYYLAEGRRMWIAPKQRSEFLSHQRMMIGGWENDAPGDGSQLDDGSPDVATVELYHRNLVRSISASLPTPLSSSVPLLPIMLRLHDDDGIVWPHIHKG